MRHESRIVRIGPADTEQVILLHRRCSVATLWSRYHRAMGDPRSYLGGLLTRLDSVHLAVRHQDGRLVAVGHLMPDGDRAEAALLVEDLWQNQGLGTRLLRHLGGHAVGHGWRAVYGLVLPGDERILAMLRRTSIPVQRVEEEGVTTVWADTGDIADALPLRRGRSRQPTRAGDW